MILPGEGGSPHPARPPMADPRDRRSAVNLRCTFIFQRDRRTGTNRLGVSSASAKETKMRTPLALLLVAVGVSSVHAASCNLPSSVSAMSASYSGRFFDADGSVTKVGKCVLTGLTRNGDTAATFQFDNTCGPLVVVTTTGFATRLTKKGSQLAECSGWDIDSGGNTTILSVIQTDSTTAARKGEKDVSTFGSSGKVFVGKLTAKY